MPDSGIKQNIMVVKLGVVPCAGNFESNMVNFEFWLNLTRNLTKNRNCLKLTCEKTIFAYKDAKFFTI